MNRTATMRAALALFLWLSGAGAAAQTGEGCPHTFDTVPASVRSILDPFYTGRAPSDGLGSASEQLRALLNEANVCRLMVMSSDNQSSTKQRDIMEWQSLNQWLERLVNFVGLNATGHTNVDWRVEYEIFAELYGIDI